MKTKGKLRCCVRCFCMQIHADLRRSKETSCKHHGRKEFGLSTIFRHNGIFICGRHTDIEGKISQWQTGQKNGQKCDLID